MNFPFYIILINTPWWWRTATICKGLLDYLCVSLHCCILISALKCVCVCVHAHAQSLSRVWLCDPMDCSLPGFSVHRIFQARILESGLPLLTHGLNPHLLRLLRSLPPHHLWSLSLKSCRSNDMCIFLSVMYRGSSRVICSLGLGSSPRCGCWATSPLPSHWKGLSPPV